MRNRLIILLLLCATGAAAQIPSITTSSKIRFSDGNTIFDRTVGDIFSTIDVDLSDGVTGVLPVANGGTGATTFTTGRVLFGNGSSAVATDANLTWTDASDLLSVTGTEQISIPTTMTATTNGLRIANTVTSATNSIKLYGIRNTSTTTNDGTPTGNSLFGFYSDNSVSGNTALSNYSGISAVVSNTSANVSQMYGVYGVATESTASGSLSNRAALRFDLNKATYNADAHTGQGIAVNVQDNSSTGRWSTGYGYNISVTNALTSYGGRISQSNSRGTGNTQYGLDISQTTSGSGVTSSNVYGINLTHTESSSGAITNYYAIRSASTPAATTNYALYFSGAGWASYLNGGLSLGVDDHTNARLVVRGTGGTSATYAQIIEKSDGTDYFVARDDGKVGIGNNTTLARALHVTGEARITDLVTDTPTKIVGADADGDLDTVGIGAEAELHITSGTLGTNFHTTISPSQITSDQNNWNPTNLATAWIIRVDADASFRSITGITAPTFNKRLTLHNVSANAVLLPTEFPSSTAANRFAFGRDVVLFPGKSVEIIYDVTTARWRLVATAGIYADVEHLYFNTSFNAPVSVTAGDFDFFNITSAATATKVSPVAGRNSGVAVNTGSSATGLGYVASKDVYFVTNNSSGTASWAYCKAVVKTPASLSDGTNDYTLRIGFNATTGDGTADGAYFDYNHSNVSGNWGCNTTNASNVQRNNSGVAVAAATVYVLEVVLRPNLTAAFFINGTQVATNDTFVPSGDALLVLSEIQKSIGTTQRDLTVYTLQTSVATVK